MSVRILTAALAIPLPTAEKITLICLANTARDDGTEAWRTMARLAAETGLTERSVRRSLRALEQRGLIAVMRPAHAGRKLATVYRIAVPITAETGDTVSPLGRGTSCPPSDGTGDTVSGVGGTSCPPSDGTGDTVSGVGGTLCPQTGDTVSGVGGTLCPQTGDTVSPSPSNLQESGGGDAGAREAIEDDVVVTPGGRAVAEIVGIDVRTTAGWWTLDTEVAKWRQAGCDLEQDILPAVRDVMRQLRANGSPPPNSPRYFAKAVLRTRDERLRPLPTARAARSGRFSMTLEQQLAEFTGADRAQME